MRIKTPAQGDKIIVSHLTAPKLVLRVISVDEYDADHESFHVTARFGGGELHNAWVRPSAARGEWEVYNIQTAIAARRPRE